jgi:hypothetical protein
MAKATPVQKLLYQPVRVRGSGSPNPCRPVVEAQSTADKMNWHAAKEAVYRVYTPTDLRCRAGGQQAETEFAQEGKVPFVVGEARTRFAYGQVRVKLRPMLAQPIPGLGDYLVKALALRQAIILRESTIELLFRIKYTTEKVWRKQAALGADGLKFSQASCHVSPLPHASPGRRTLQPLAHSGPHLSLLPQPRST